MTTSSECGPSARNVVGPKSARAPAPTPGSATPLDGFTQTVEITADLLAQRFKLETIVDAGAAANGAPSPRSTPAISPRGECADRWSAALDTSCAHERCMPMAACSNN